MRILMFGMPMLKERQTKRERKKGNREGRGEKEKSETDRWGGLWFFCTWVSNHFKAVALTDLAGEQGPNKIKWFTYCPAELSPCPVELPCHLWESLPISWRSLAPSETELCYLLWYMKAHYSGFVSANYSDLIHVDYSDLSVLTILLLFSDPSLSPFQFLYIGVVFEMYW